MKVFINIRNKIVYLTMRVVGDGVIGDAYREVKKGQEVFGVSYVAFIKYGNGMMDIKVK